MTTLKQARDSGTFDQFIAEHDADEAGDETASIDVAALAKGCRQISAALKCHVAEMKAFERRLKFFEISVAKGDPRFTKPEFAREGFDTAKHDTWAASRNLPSPATCDVLVEWAS